MRPFKIPRLHHCPIPVDDPDLTPGTTWNCSCGQRWRCYEGPWIGGKLFERVTFIQWLLGLDSSE